MTAADTIKTDALVLVVDDDRLMRTIFRDALEKSGYRTLEAPDGQTAINCFQESRPDLILLDMVMPGLDGLHTCQTIRQLPGGQYLPVLMVTGMPDSWAIHEAFNAGTTDFIAKPVNTELLTYRVEYMLRASKNLRSLAASEAQLAHAQQIAALGNWEWDTESGAFTGSREAVRILGLPDSSPATFSDFLGTIIAADRAGVESGLQNAFASTIPFIGECRINSSGEEPRIIRLQGYGEKVADRPARHMVGTIQDVTDMKQAENRINQLAYFDTLTGLPNRRTFFDRLSQALALANREANLVGLLFLDLDNFKDINDTLGHEYGDRFLREVANRLGEIMRESDTLARLGGDEFVIILNAIATMESAAIVARRILTLISHPINLEGKQFFTSASIGIALYPDDGQDPESLFKCADTAMYHAKETGKAAFRFFSSDMNLKIMRRVALENGLRQGIGSNDLFLQYQPQWELQSKRMIGVEALVRWQNPDIGLIMPTEFISLAEISGLIIPLGEWVLRSACCQAKKWQDDGYGHLRMAINISGKQLTQPDFLGNTRRIIKESGVNPASLEFEFTESVLMDNAEKAIGSLRELKQLGLRLSIDDFGTGYSSLSYLKHFPIDRVKIDRSFVTDVTVNSDDAAIVTAIISMSHSLNLKVIAEGVETPEQMQFLQDHGCDEIQGFYLARPLPADDVIKKLAESG